MRPCRANPVFVGAVLYVVIFAVSRLLLEGFSQRPPSGLKLSVLSTDFHISPIRDLKDIMRRMPEFSSVSVVDESFSGHCKMTGTCARKLRVLNPENGISLGDCPNQLKQEFWREYHQDKWMVGMDMYICHHAVALCEVYLPFDRPIVIVSTTRYELGRHDANSWARLNQALTAIAAKEFNTVAANSVYDVEYLRHFTGIENVLLLPSLCAYVDSYYLPTKKEFLVGPSRLSNGGNKIFEGAGGLLESLLTSNLSDELSFKRIRELYPHYSFKDLAAHPAIVIIPYQVSIMSLFEYYAIGIPLFVPSLELLVQWQIKYLLLDELSWNCVFGRCDEKSAIVAHPNSPHRGTDPNDILNTDNLRYWLKFADFYQWPGVLFFESWSDLFHQVQHTDFAVVSRTMMNFNAEKYLRVRRAWLEIFRRARGKTAATADKFEDSWAGSILRTYPELDEDILLSEC